MRFMSSTAFDDVRKSFEIDARKSAVVVDDFDDVDDDGDVSNDIRPTSSSNKLQIERKLFYLH